MGYYYSGEPDLAKFEMQEVLLKDPLCFKAYHWLVRLSVEDEWEGLRKRIEGVIGKCPKDVRDFRLLLGYVRYLEGRLDEALKIYQELADELPEDYRPYLYLGVINVVSLKSNEAKMHFEKYRSLVPKDEPDSVHFEINVDITHVLIQALEY